MTEPAAGVETSAHHLPALDGLRGIAILMVLGFHLFGTDRQSSSVINFLYRLTASGWMGVDLFFVLSGFLITGILLDTKKSFHGIRNFYVRRMLRIFPLYYGLLVCGLAAAYWYWPNDPATNGPLGFKINQIWLWTYTINFRTAYIMRETVPAYHAGRLIYAQFWSLAVEEHFYLIWPLIVVSVSRRSLIKVCLITLFAGILGRIVYYALTHNPNTIYLDTQFRLDGLLCGALAGLGFRSSVLCQYVKWHLILVFTIGIAGFLALVSYTEFQSDPIHKDYLISTLGYTILAASFTLIVLALAVAPATFVASKPLRWRPLRLLGKYSYGIYAIHLTIISAIGSRLEDRAYVLLSSRALADFTVKVCLTLITILFAFLSFHLYEMQFMRLKRFFPQRTNLARP